MKVFFDQIPEEYSPEAYPEETEFVLDDSRPARNPATFRLINPEKRVLVYPEDIK